MSLNKVILIGNVGKDPEIRTMNNGNEVALFSLATSEYWKDKATGEKKDKTEWHRVVVYSQGLVNIVKNYVKKGTRLYLCGSIQSRKWTDNKGIDRQLTEIVLQGYAGELQILSSVSCETNNMNTDNKQLIDNFVKDMNAYVVNEPREVSFAEEYDELEINDEIPF